MFQYETRILNAKLCPALIIEAFHLNDTVAIRAATLFASGRSVEVWRDMDCIHRAASEPMTVKAA